MNTFLHILSLLSGPWRQRTVSYSASGKKAQQSSRTLQIDSQRFLILECSVTVRLDYQVNVTEMLSGHFSFPIVCIVHL